jgi:hypothetical protein
VAEGVKYGQDESLFLRSGKEEERTESVSNSFNIRKEAQK